MKHLMHTHPLVLPFLLTGCFLLVAMGFFRDAWYQYWYHTAKLGMRRL